MPMSRHYRPIALLVMIALLLQPMLQAFALASVAPIWLHPFAVDTAKAQSADQVYLPIITKGGSSTPMPTPTPTPTPSSTPVTPPSFIIMAPSAGSTVAGTINFAIQPLNAISITNVSFQVGVTQVGVDNTPSDGFRVFVNTKTLAAGNQQFTATATGPSGNATQSVTVNVVPNPPSAATIGNQGGVLATARGSVISILPNSVAAGTAVTVTELTQSEVQLQNGINWEKIGVTFLGAQQIDSTAPFSRPLGMVASAGFGNRVQPGQAVVNYRLAPDADGDGVDEIVVVNTASVAPDNNVVSDPIQPVSVAGTQILSKRAGASSQVENLEFQVIGFNSYSPFGNTALFHSLVDGTKIEVIGLVEFTNSINLTQTFSVVIPSIQVGPAIVTLINQSTGVKSTPITIEIEEASPLSRPADEIIEDFLTLSLTFLNSITESTNIDTSAINQLTSTLTSIQNEFNQLRSSSDIIVQQGLEAWARTIENTGSLSLLKPNYIQLKLRSGVCKTIKTVLKAIVVGNIDAVWCVFKIPFGTICRYAKEFLTKFLTYQIESICEDEKPPPCTPSQSGPNGPTGMGSAPPPGGNGCGSAGGGGGGSQSLVAANQQATGSIFIKVFSNGTATPFTGMVDPGGYFFVPFIPQDEPFIAVAYDTSTGETRKFKGIGPKTGKSVFMYFDFFNPAPPDITVANLNDSGVGSLRQAVADAQIGDHIGFAISGTLTLASQIVISKSISIDGPSNDQIVISGNYLTRTFEIAKDATVTLTHLRITDGKALNGGGIYNSGDLTIVDSVLAQNSAIESGGAIYNFGNNNTRSKLTLRNSNVISNSAEHGGGIKNCCNFVYAYTTLTLQESLIAGNTAKFSGGGIALGYETTTQVISSTITQNKTMDESGWGGGLFILEGGAHLISGSQVTENFASGRGGGIATGANITLIDTTVSHNKAASYGGGIAGIGLVVYDLTLIDSTITQNEAMDGNGGGIYDLTNLYAFNSTIANNRAIKQQNSIGGRGGGIVINGDFTVLFTTITGNYADVACGGVGRSLPHNPNHTWKASIIASNSAPSNPDYCPGSETTLISLGYNIIGDGTGTGFVNGVNNDQVGVDPLLKPLANNGGNTPTIGLQSSSPAINKIPPTNCTDQNGKAVTSDQRGVSRPQEGACDVGAYEYP